MKSCQTSSSHVRTLWVKQTQCRLGSTGRRKSNQPPVARDARARIDSRMSVPLQLAHFPHPCLGCLVWHVRNRIETPGQSVMAIFRCCLFRLPEAPSIPAQAMTPPNKAPMCGCWDVLRRRCLKRARVGLWVGARCRLSWKCTFVTCCGCFEDTLNVSLLVPGNGTQRHMDHPLGARQAGLQKRSLGTGTWPRTRGTALSHDPRGPTSE